MRALRLFVIRRLSYGSRRAQRTPAQACVLVHAEELLAYQAGVFQNQQRAVKGEARFFRRNRNIQPVLFDPTTPRSLRFRAVQTFTGVLPRDLRPQNRPLSP